MRRMGLALLALPTLGAADPVAHTVELRAGTAPQAVVIDGARQLFYELHVTNLSRRDLTLDALTIADQADRPLARFDRATLNQLIDGPAIAPEAIERTALPPGARAIVHLQLPVGERDPVRLAHRVTLAAGDSRIAVTAPMIAVAPARLPELGPPLTGGLWAAVYAPDLNFGHRRYVYALGGVARIPGRFAIDFFRVRPDGSHDKTGGEPVLAVADATVASVRDDMPDAAAPGNRPALADATGNYVSLALGGGRYAFYEHLRQGVRVRPGQRVRRGQVIGLVGMTGQANRPHLHFHVADTDSPLGAEGVPYRLTGFTRLGGYADIRAFDRAAPFAAAPPRAVDGLPPPNSVGRFPGTATGATVCP